MEREPPVEANVRIPADSVKLDGIMGLPRGAQGIVAFAHGSGSSRLSPRNGHVARVLQATGLGTLLFDLLTEREAAHRVNVFDVMFLAQRLRAATAWIRQQEATTGLRIAYFGASTGAAAALIAAAADPSVRAIVSRGGRPDLATAALPNVKVPTLLIVGGLDRAVIRMNEQAYKQLRCEKQMCIVAGATHLFEEPGTLDEVTSLATAWFRRHLCDRGGDA
ncbi:MAG: dienelactone hydrolase family protein [Candidatus Binatia bacterium]